MSRYIKSLKINPKKEDIQPNIVLDFSTMNAIDSCARKGLISSYLGKKYKEDVSRNMALEAGDLCHKAYALFRCYSLPEDMRDSYMIKFMSQVLPGADNDFLMFELRNIYKQQEDCLMPTAKYMIIGDWVLNNSGYMDNEDDKKRTLANIRDSLCAYVSYFVDLVIDEPVWISDDKTVVGIELPFEFDISLLVSKDNIDKYEGFRFIGKIDGIHIKDGELIIHENKTASRLDDAWLGQWETSHQITGYCLAASALVNSVIQKARVLGNQIPVPKSSGYSFRTDRVDREDFSTEDWALWVTHILDIIHEYKDTPEVAPMCTKNCCAYYSKCTLMPICRLNRQERIEAIKEMVVQKWSPLDE